LNTTHGLSINAKGDSICHIGADTLLPGNPERQTILFDDIHTENTRLNSDIQDFLIHASRAYHTYRLTALTADGTNIGLSYFQIYIKNYYGVVA